MTAMEGPGKSWSVSMLGIAVAAAGLILIAGYFIGYFGAGRGWLGTSPERLREGAPVAAGESAAEFRLQDLGGRTVSLRSLRGKVVFLNVWATWCGPCLQEMPSMETLYNEFRNDRDFVMLAVSQDEKGRDAVAPYVEKNGFHFEILLDPHNEVSQKYNVTGVPETFIIDREGRIVAHHVGAFDWSLPEIKETFEELLDSRQTKRG